MSFEGLSNNNCPMLVRHKRSKSFPGRKGLVENPRIPSTLAAESNKLNIANLSVSSCDDETTSNAQQSLRNEISLLGKRLQNQVSVRCALEKELDFEASSSKNIESEASITKTEAELLKEIAVLEVEVLHLEKHILSLYRKVFDQQVASNNDEIYSAPLGTPKRRLLEFSRSCNSTSEFAQVPKSHVQMSSRTEATGPSVMVSRVPRFWSSSKNDEAFSSPLQTPRRYAEFSRSYNSSSEFAVAPKSHARTRSKEAGSSAQTTMDSAVPCFQSSILPHLSLPTKPLSMMENDGNSSANNIISLAEHLSSGISDHISTTPNELSEDMVKCMCTIYYKLAEPSLGRYSPNYQCDSLSPRFRSNLCFDVQIDNPFHVQGLKDFTGPYSRMIEVKWLPKDINKFVEVECLLENFRSLVHRLDAIDLKTMTHEGKLAFWLNIHNALVMHSFLAFGIPQNNIKRTFQHMKAAYNVGGRVVTAETIQNSILRCRIPHSTQLMRFLLPTKSKYTEQAFSIDHPEPLTYFALSSGRHSDPAVRVYHSKRVFQELKAAKEDYIRASLGVGKDNRILVPKLIECFAKDSNLSQDDILKMIHGSLPDSLRICIKKCMKMNNRRRIDFFPHNFGFRYLIMKEQSNQ